MSVGARGRRRVSSILSGVLRSWVSWSRLRRIASTIPFTVFDTM